MNGWEDIVLIVLTLGAFAFGYFLVIQLGKYLDRSRIIYEREYKGGEPSEIMFAETMSEEEIAREVGKFRAKHKKARVVLREVSGPETREDAGDTSGKKK